MMHIDDTRPSNADYDMPSDPYQNQQPLTEGVQPSSEGDEQVSVYMKDNMIMRRI